MIVCSDTMWRKGLTATSFAIAALAVFSVVGCGSGTGSTSGNAVNTQPEIASSASSGIDQQIQRAAELEAQIKAVEAANIIARNTDGTYSVNATTGRAAGLDSAALSLAQDSVAQLNRKIQDGEIESQNVSLSSNSISRANEQGLRVYWWGVRLAINNSNSQKLKPFAHVGAVGLGTFIGGLFGSVIPGLGTGAGAIAGSMLGQVGVEYIDWAIGKNRGIFVDCTWSRSVTMTPQS